MTKESMMDILIENKSKFRGTFAVEGSSIRLSDTLVLTFDEQEVTIEGFDIGLSVAYSDIESVDVMYSNCCIELSSGYEITLYSVG